MSRIGKQSVWLINGGMSLFVTLTILHEDTPTRALIGVAYCVWLAVVALRWILLERRAGP